MLTNQIHIDLVKRGAKKVNDWRKRNPNQILDLSGAKLKNLLLREINLTGSQVTGIKLALVDLRGAHLSRINGTKIGVTDSILDHANLSRLNLSHSSVFNSSFYNNNFSKAKIISSYFGGNLFLKCDFKNTNLHDTEFFENTFGDCDFSESNLTKSKISFSQFRFSNFSNTDFSASKISGSIFYDCKFDKTDLTDAKFEGTSFITCDLSECMELATVKHLYYTNIDFMTIKRTFVSSKNCLTSEFMNFLFSAGIPMEMIQQLPKILGQIKYRSSFICYGQPDIDFAEKLQKDLASRGVVCWLYSLDSTVGERTWKEIMEQRRKAEKMIVLCSSNSLIREGALKEIEEQIDEDPEKIIPISLDELWKQNGFSIRRGKRNLKPFLLERNYANFSSQSEYQKSLNKLLKGLKVKKA
jgi:uncharacterized protein YjbI with pentapeptide repeats